MATYVKQFQADTDSYAAGDLQIAISAVRNDGGSTTLINTNGKYGPVAVDAAGRIWINGSYVDSTGYTAASSRGVLVMGSVTTSAPTYTNATMRPLSLDTSGNLRVSGAVTVSGSPNVNIHDGAGTAISSDLRGSKQALTVEIVDASGNQITSFGGSGSGRSPLNAYDEDTAVPGSSETIILTYVAPSDMYVQGMCVSASVECHFRLKIDGTTSLVARTSTAQRTITASLYDGGIAVTSGQTVTITAYHEAIANQTAETSMFGYA